MFSEETLYTKYKSLIWKTVWEYTSAFKRFSAFRTIHDDLLNEAALTFLSTCRNMEIVDGKLNALQTSIVKQKIRSTLRVYIWRYFGMGGNNNAKKIDFDRIRTISDMTPDEPDNCDDSEFEDEMFSYYAMEEDYSVVEIREFINSLTPVQKEVLKYIAAGYDIQQTAKRVGICRQAASNQLSKIKDKLVNDMLVAA